MESQVKTIDPKNIEKLDKLLRKSKRPIALREIADHMNVTYPTAKNWFEEWAKSNDYESGYARIGMRGPESYVVKAL